MNTRRMNRLVRWLLTTCLILTMMLTVAGPARAASYVVVHPLEEDLRKAILAANAAAGEDTITFNVSGTILLTRTLPAITDPAGLTIDGAGQSITISGNNVVRVMEVNYGAALTLRNLTVADGNWSVGGGIYNVGTLSVTNATFSGNYGGGAGIFNGGTLTLKNTIVANSNAVNCLNNSSLIDDGGNLSWPDTSCPGLHVDPLLGPLQDNGGPTQTHALLAGSPAIDAALLANCLATDQRGVSRPQGAGCDLGAYELGVESITPTITINTPADGAIYVPGQAVLADYACQDEAGGSGIASCVGTAPNGGPIDTGSVGAKTFTVNAADNAGNLASLTRHYSVVYAFSGFLQPLDNLLTMNVVQAGLSIPVRFSLSSNHGLDIFAAGYPASPKIPCAGGAPENVIEETVKSGSSSLSYDAASDTYTYVWVTSRAWAGTCRQLNITLNDGAEHEANFKFIR